MNAQGLLLDLEGVLYQDGAALAGAREALAELARRGLAMRYLTNTTVRPRRQVWERLRHMGFDVAVEHIFTPALAAVALLREAGARRLRLVAPAGLAEDFSAYELAHEAVDAVVMGDAHRDFDWSLLNEIFVLLRGGARLIALHKNRYCRRDGEIALDLGPFVAAVEYASGVSATVVGKPSGEFFRLALQDLALAAADVIMVGDDPVADIGGGQSAGLRAVQVRTGKYDPDDPAGVAPDVLIDSIADLPDVLA